jgi:predicted signal transduction protein with EAL and GGDEF domain
MVSPTRDRRSPRRPQEVDVDGSRSNVIEHPRLVQRAQLVDAAQRDALTGGPITDLVLDPDDLADVNARLGWEAGDRLLVELADRLQVRLCSAGVTTHLDLDRLGIRCVGLACDHAVAADVVRALATPLELGAELVEVRAS